MQILINIIVTFVLMFWPVMFMMSPMMFDAPGSDNNKSQLVTMMLILCYPIGLFLLLWIFGGSYFGFSGLKLAIISAVVIVFAYTVFGYFGMLFNLQKGIANTGYSVVDNHVYYDGKIIEAADGASFDTVDDEENPYTASDYALDKDHLYYSGKIVEGAFIDELKKVTVNRDTHWINKTQVIYNGNIMPGANPGDFGGFEGFAGWTHSMNNDQYLVFSYGVPLPAVDKATFTPLNDFIAKDNQHIFEKHKPILTEADAATFELLDDHDFGKDKNYIYYLATKLPFAVKGVDVASFEILERGYLKDKNSVYIVHQYESIEKLEQVDVDSFEATQYDDINKSEARDANHYYYDGKVVGDR